MTAVLKVSVSQPARKNVVPSNTALSAYVAYVGAAEAGGRGAGGGKDSRGGGLEGHGGGAEERVSVGYAHECR